MLRQKLEYIHYNPVRIGLVDRPEDWRYSSARNYLGQDGVLEIDSVELWGPKLATIFVPKCNLGTG
jgi:hypothetical protein